MKNPLLIHPPKSTVATAVHGSVIWIWHVSFQAAQSFSAARQLWPHTPHVIGCILI